MRKVTEVIDDLSITRRRALGVLAATVVGGISLSPTTVDDELSATERELSKLATMLMEQNLARPVTVKPARRQVDSTISSVESFLNSQQLAEARDDAAYWHGVNDRLSRLPGLETPSEPQIEGRVAAIKQALYLYKELEDVLSKLHAKQQAVGESETTVLTTNKSQPPAQDLEFSTLLQSVAELEEKTPSSPKTTQLVPDIAALKNELERQVTAYRAHIQLQAQYARAGREFDTGARLWEDGTHSKARAAFEEARDSSVVELPDVVETTPVVPGGLTINQYRAVFTQYEAATEAMIAACRTSDTAMANDRFDDGISALLKAREMVSNTVWR